MRAKWIGGGIGWSILAMMALGASSDPAMAVPVWMFWVGSGIGGVVLFRRVRGLGSRTRSGCVTVCVPLAKNAQGLTSAYAALPRQLWHLFEQP